MKRWTLRILLLFILGGVTTAGVAWGLVYFSVELHGLLGREDTRTFDRYRIGDPRLDEIGISSVHATPGAIEITLNWASEGRARDTRPTMAAPSWSRFRDPDRLRMGEMAWRPITQFDFPLIYRERACGWPLYALDSSEVFYSREFRSEPLGVLGSPLVWKHNDGGRADYPLRPMWPGFLINTFFYALIWLGLLFGFTSFRRVIRRRRGRCPKCGYDLRGELNDGCSECGWNRAPIAKESA